MSPSSKERVFTRAALEEREAETLAPYASHSAESFGREYPEEEHSYRTCWQRDKDRIIHCTAFRRLEYKTQVFVNHEGDYYRTRLTHTIEVAQIARSLARSLGLNEDLVEAVALVHDLGHTPFGHSGEEALDPLVKEVGGFEHNAQGLRVVEDLEDRYPQFPGLNLTLEVREGLIKGREPYARKPRQRDPRVSPSPPLEAQLVNLADEIAYNSHDVDDGIKSELLRLEDFSQVALCRQVFEEIEDQLGKLNPSNLRHELVKRLINRQSTDVVEYTAKVLNETGIDSLAAVREHPTPLIQFSPEMKLKNQELKEFLANHLYQHYQVIRMSDKARRMIADLFRLYRSKIEQLPPECRNKCEKDPIDRVVADYIAGMTDRYASEEYRKLFLPPLQF